MIIKMLLNNNAIIDTIIKHINTPNTRNILILVLK